MRIFLVALALLVGSIFGASAACPTGWTGFGTCATLTTADLPGISDTTHVTSAPLSNVGGQDNYNGSSLTATIPGTGTIGNGQSFMVINQAASALNLTESQTVNGCPVTSLAQGGFIFGVGNGSSIDAGCFPGFKAVSGDVTCTAAAACTVNKIGGTAITLGTLTDGDVCTYTASGTVLNCNTSPAGTGTVTTITAGAGIALSSGATCTTTCTISTATTLTSGGSTSLSVPGSYYECTGTCSITLPTPVSGAQFCIRNANNISTVITLVAIASVQFENTNFTSYKTANTSILSGGAAGDKMCVVGNGTTKYDVFSFNGTWS